MKPETLEHALAEAIAKRLTDGHTWAIECRVLAYEAALEGVRLGVAASRRLPLSWPPQPTARACAMPSDRFGRCRATWPKPSLSLSKGGSA